MTTVGDIVNDCIVELSHVPGIAIQIYSAPRLRLHVQNAFQMEIQEMWWPEYGYTTTVALDGTTGSITSDLLGPLGYTDDYGDIRAVYAEGSNRKLREFPPGNNPLVAAPSTSGGRPFYVSANYTVPHRPLRVYPLNATGNVTIVAMGTPPLPFTDDLQIYLDRLLLMYDACWMYATDDGTVPAQVNRFQLLASNRRKQMKAKYAQMPLELDPRYPSGDIALQDADSGWFTLDTDPLA